LVVTEGAAMALGDMGNEKSSWRRPRRRSRGMGRLAPIV